MLLDDPIWLTADRSAFRSCLDQHGTAVTSTDFYEVVALVILRAVASELGDLTYSGLGLEGRYPHTKGTPSDIIEQKVTFERERRRLTDDGVAIEFLRALAYLQSATAERRRPLPTTSYGLKHLAETTVCTYPDGRSMGSGYVSNGVFIAAAMHAGVPWRLTEGEPNVVLDMKRYLARPFD